MIMSGLWPASSARLGRAAGTVLLVGAMLLSGACSGGGSSSPAGGPAASATGVGPALREGWRWVAPPPAYAGMPVADGEGVAVVTGQTWLVLLDGLGHERWRAEHGAGLRDVAPLLTPELVVSATDVGLAAFGRADGAVRWVADIGERANTPVIAGGAVVTSTWEGSLLAVDPGGGQLLWRVPLGGAALGPPATDGQLVVTTWEAENGAAAGATAVDATSAIRRWDVPMPAGGMSGPSVVASGTVVAVAGDRAAHGLDTGTGAERWRAELEGAGSPEVPPLALPGGDVLVAHRLGGVARLNGADGALGWSVASDGAAVRGGPVGPGPDGWFALPLDDGRVLVAGPGAGAGAGTTDRVDAPGRVAGVAAGPGGVLVVATRESDVDGMVAWHGW